eukprot:GABV01001227.1.p1 GENE.GABV01001227.1~~GABV01001227.1.p1  ORF type:complete len:186 (-),score=68.78 GABV01001227.1:46-603(-)
MYEADVARLLQCVRDLAPTPELKHRALWGQCAANILNRQWDDALESIAMLRESIELVLAEKPLDQLQHRVWLLHWSLYVYFNVDGGRKLFINAFKDKFINAVQVAAPHLLRYVAAATMLDGNRARSTLIRNQIAEAINQERLTYADPVTEFIRALVVDADFEAARSNLLASETIFDNDFFCRLPR